MQGIHDILQNMPKPVVLSAYQCEGCGQVVSVTEMAIAGGPDKGKIEKFYLGCKCEDIILAEMVLKNDRRARGNRQSELFNTQSLINESIKKATFENYVPPSPELAAAKGRLQQFVQHFKPVQSRSLLLKGPYGTGKSHLAYSAARALLDAGYSALYLSVPKLLTKIKETYNGSVAFSEAQLLEYVESVDLLVLDDLGAEYTNIRNGNDNWVWSKLFEVVDGRAGKPTIYTTNLSSAELEQKVGTRNFSRILDGTEILVMNGKDYRRKAF